MTGGTVMTQAERKQERDRLYNEVMELSRTLKDYRIAKKAPGGSPERERIERFPIKEEEIRQALKEARERYKDFIKDNY